MSICIFICRAVPGPPVLPAISSGREHTGASIRHERPGCSDPQVSACSCPALSPGCSRVGSLQVLFAAMPLAHSTLSFPLLPLPQDSAQTWLLQEACPNTQSSCHPKPLSLRLTSHITTDIVLTSTCTLLTSQRAQALHSQYGALTWDLKAPATQPDFPKCWVLNAPSSPVTSTMQTHTHQCWGQTVTGNKIRQLLMAGWQDGDRESHL